MTSSTAWILWVLAGMVFLLSTRNPIYLMLVIISLLLLGHKLALNKHQAHWARNSIRFLVTMVLLSTLINSLFSRFGRNVLFIIPLNWPLVGGNITLESLVYGTINGLVIGALYLQFHILNLSLNIKQIVRLVPRAFHPIAMTISVALTFFPSIQRRVIEIKEAQLIRGNPMKKIVDWLPILIPLMVSSLENAILLSESMTVKGFHSYSSSKSGPVLASLMMATFSIFSGWILHLYQYPILISLTLYIFGGAIILLVFYWIGKRSNITRYHKESWGKGDYILAILMSLYLVAFISLSLLDLFSSRMYSPYPALTAPTLQIHGIIFSIVMVMPIFFNSND